MRLKYEKVIHHAIVNNLFGFGYTKKSCNAQGSSKYYLFVTAPFLYGAIQKRRFALKRPSCIQLCFKGRVKKQFSFALVY